MIYDVYQSLTSDCNPKSSLPPLQLQRGPILSPNPW